MTAQSGTRGRIVPEWHRLALAAVLLVLLLVQLLFASDFQTSTWLPVTAAIVSVACILTADRWPWPSIIVVALATALLGLLGASSILLWIAPAVVAYATTSRFGRLHGIAAALAGGVALAFSTEQTYTALVLGAAAARGIIVVGGAAAFGETSRLRRERLVATELRAEEAEKTREALAALALEEERCRIARELHDVTAHSMAAIAIQSQLAQRSVRSDPDAAENALGAIGDTSRQALGELRAMVSGLRSDAQEGPSPSLSRLGELIAQLDSAGIDVCLTFPERLDSIPPFVDATAYRIVQEAATNVIRHADALSVDLDVQLTAAELRLRVQDDGRAARTVPDGHGLTGMRERAAAIGGTLHAGPAPCGGWLIEAILPLATETRTSAPRETK